MIEGVILPRVLGRLVVGDQEFEARIEQSREMALGPLARGVADRDGTPLNAAGERIEAAIVPIAEADDEDEKELNGETAAPALDVSEDAVKQAEAIVGGTAPADESKGKRAKRAD